jgi:hypothetical protein
MWPPSRVWGVTARSRLTRAPTLSFPSVDRRQANAVDRDRIAFDGILRDERRRNPNFRAGDVFIQSGDPAEFFNYSGEHFFTFPSNT